ncbi:MAG: zinc-dependent metalloprotease [Mesonia hippocampi]|uniref:zinc-dependent metalloprotease n=1 Tax=Mesonia hippocampi TaxID=1628250 RepID=UPI003F985F1F
MKKIATLLLFCVSMSLWAQEKQDYWQVSNANFSAVSTQSVKFQLNIAKFRTVITSIVPESTEIQIPSLSGNLVTYKVQEFSNFSPELAAKYPSIKSYRGYAVNNPSEKISISLTQTGIKVSVIGDKGTSVVQPIENSNTYEVKLAEEIQPASPLQCYVEESVQAAVFNTQSQMGVTSDGVFRTYRLAVATDGEYSELFNNDPVLILGGINDVLSFINPIYENDLSIHLELIANTDDLFYTNKLTDPFTGNQGNIEYEIQPEMTNVIGEANYDVGILFSGRLGGGKASGIGAVCVDNTKGGAYAGTGGSAAPDGYYFAVNLVAHELGHMFGANHTFSRTEYTGVNVEPGSGNTIMGYAGVTFYYDVQKQSEAQFSFASIFQITNYIESVNCAVETPLTNTAPIVDAGMSYTIPKGTAFKLTAQGSDADSDVLTYSWEQSDSNFSNPYDYSYPSPTLAGNQITPSYKVFPHTESPERYFPSLEKILKGKLYSTWEMTSDVSKTMSFVVTARDNNPVGGQIALDYTEVEVVETAGPFAVTSISSTDAYVAGNQHNLTWDVANANQAPVNTTLVNILISTDNGETFTTLLANTANDGQENITLPNQETEGAFIIIEAVDNIFLAASPKFTIGNIITPQYCNNYTGAPVAIGSISNQAVSTSFSVPQNGTITDLNLTVDITHGNIGNLGLILVAPGGSATSDKMIFIGNCYGDGSLNITFDQEAAESLPMHCGDLTGQRVEPLNLNLADYYGEDMQGVWELYVWNLDGGETGMLNSATLEICTEEDLSTNTYNLDKQTEISVYPNPSKGQLYIDYTNTAVEGNASLEVYDLTGKLIYIENNLKQLPSKIDLSFLTKGLYIMKIKDAKTSFVEKIIIE